MVFAQRRQVHAKLTDCASTVGVSVRSLACGLDVCPVGLEQRAQPVLAYLSLKLAVSFRSVATIGPFH